LNGLDNPLDDREPISSRRLSGVEGKPKESLITRYERNRLLRQEAINRTGERCSVCGFSFFEEYGELGKGFVEVHHIVPLSMTRTARITDSVNDLVVVCSNCHSMLHRNNPVLLPSELSNIINKAKTKASA
jgi:5-methylcytosine-specific restriction protein A